MAPMPRRVFQCRLPGLVVSLGMLVLLVLVPGCSSDKNSGPTSPGYASGSSGCNLSEEVIAGYPDVYAQLTIATPGSAGQPMVVICSSGWQ